MSLAEAVPLAHLAATLVMTGMIWVVQVVHDPLFRQVGEPAFVAYAARHARPTRRVVTAPVLVEAATGVLFPWRRPSGVPAA